VNFLKKEHIVTCSPEPGEPRKYFGRKVEMEERIDE